MYLMLRSWSLSCVTFAWVCEAKNFSIFPKFDMRKHSQPYTLSPIHLAIQEAKKVEHCLVIPNFQIQD